MKAQGINQTHSGQQRTLWKICQRPLSSCERGVWIRSAGFGACSLRPLDFKEQLQGGKEVLWGGTLSRQGPFLEPYWLYSHASY